MITKRTRVQLVIFAIITLLGVSFVGARYARLDRLVLDRSYDVTAHFAESGGIFTGAEVSYRGVTVGQVSKMELTDEGVDVILDIENKYDSIPEETKALVANRSAVGEQFVDLQPQVKKGPLLEAGSEIPLTMTDTPIETTQLLTNLDTTVRSVNKQSLRTVVNEFGLAFKGTGRDLGQIIDTSNSFIEEANANFDITTALLEDSNVVLSTQLDKASAIRSFSDDLAKFSTTVANSDADLRRVIENGSATANQLRTFLEQNRVNLGSLINNLVTTGEVTGRHLAGTEMILTVYPYVVAGGYTVVGKDPDTKLNDAHFGLILTQEPHVCKAGYDQGEIRDPNTNRGNKRMNERARCAEPASQSNARGAQNAPRRASPAYRAPVLGTYDRESGTFRYGGTDDSDNVTYTGGAARLMGEDESWKWLLAQPLAGQE